MSLDLQDPRKTLVVVRIGNQLRAGEGPLSLLRQDSFARSIVATRIISCTLASGSKSMPVGRMILMRPSLPGSTTNPAMHGSCAKLADGWSDAGHFLCGRKKFFCVSAEL
jgi:hypothetical protein